MVEPKKRVIKTPLKSASEYKLGKKVIGRDKTTLYVCVLKPDGKSHMWKDAATKQKPKAKPKAKPSAKPKAKRQARDSEKTTVADTNTNRERKTTLFDDAIPMDEDTVSNSDGESDHDDAENSTKDLAIAYRRIYPSIYSKMPSCFYASVDSHQYDTDGDYSML